MEGSLVAEAHSSEEGHRSSVGVVGPHSMVAVEDSHAADPGQGRMTYRISSYSTWISRLDESLFS